MAKPATLQLLKHGKLICKAVFPFFVETFNWVVTAFDNLRGDFDINPKNGAITIDRTNPDHPVIRLRTDNLALGGGYTGTLSRVSSMEYSVLTHKFIATMQDEAWSNGMLVSVGEPYQSEVFESVAHIPHS